MQADTVSEQGTRAIRLYQEGFEKAHLHPFAAKSGDSKGREIPEDPCPIRTAFQRDRDRVLHCKSFRRLKHKTQVFFSPVGDHYRTRLTHSLEVAQVSRTIARALRLNEDLTEAIALAHDMGHPPFGHSGERVLNALSPDGFHHYQQSVRIATVIERLNLSWEILDALRHDTGPQKPSTMEGQVVTLADRMAYLHHDVEDAVRAGLMQESDLPEEIVRVLGSDRAARLDRMVMDIISVSQSHFDSGEARIGLSPEIEAAMLALRKWMFEHVYLNPSQQKEIDKIEHVLQGLFTYYQAHPEAIPEGIPDTGEVAGRRVIDYIAGMTDRYAIDRYATLLLPAPYIPL